MTMPTLTAPDTVKRGVDGSWTVSPGIALWLIAAYLVGTRISPDGVGKLGFVLGGVPIFATEILLATLLIIILFRRPSPLLVWFASGQGARFAGFMVWILFWASIAYTSLSFSRWHVYALRDLAIFGYSIAYVLAYFALDTRRKAKFLINAFIYAGVLTSILLILDWSLGLHLLYLPEYRGVAGTDEVVVSTGGGDIGAAAAASLGAFVVLASRTRSGHLGVRFFHLAMMGICALALIVAQTRSATLGAALGIAIGLTGAKLRDVLILLIIGVGAAACILIASSIFPSNGAQQLFSAFFKAMHSGSTLTEDPNFAFRYIRWVYVTNEWKQSPLFGIGYGVPIVPDSFITGDEVGLNAGLPHNTYLTILARMGVFGLCLITIPWARTILLCFRRAGAVVSGIGDDYQRIASTILTFFAGFAGFVLFFERPWHSVPFWIVLAAANRLSAADED